MFARFVAMLIMAALLVSFDASAQQSFQESMSEFQRALAAVDAIKRRKKLQQTENFASVFHESCP
jgi:hypothetical protein